MIQKESRLKVTDNSGGKEVLMIGAQGYSVRRSFTVGDIIKVTVKDAIPHAKVKKGEIYFALIVRTKYPIRRVTGHRIAFDENAVVLLNPNLTPVGKAIFGDVPRELIRSNNLSNGTKKIIGSIVTGGVL